MGTYGVTLANRRLIMLAVLSLIASLFAVTSNAPAARATGEIFSFALADDTAVEGSGATTIDVTLDADGSNLVGAFSVDVVLDVPTSTADEGAGLDFLYPSGTTTLTFADNTPLPATQTVSIDILDDNTYEGDETVVLDLTGQTGGAGLGISTHTFTITDAADEPTISIVPSAGAVEGNQVSFRVTRSSDSDIPITFNYATADDTASAADYTNTTTNPVAIAAGAPGYSDFTVLATADTLVEGPESFNVSLHAIVGATGLATTSVGNITDANSATVAFQAGTSSASEGTTTHNIPVVLTTGGTLATAVTVDITDLGTGSATAGGGNDYTATTSVTFNPGDGNGTIKNVVLTVNDDSSVEGSETVDLALGTITGPATAGSPSSHIHTITDNEAATVAFVGGTSNDDEGTIPHTVQVVLSTGTAALGSAVTVSITDDLTGSAIPGGGNDYTLGTTSVTFNPGDGNGTTRTVNVNLNTDAVHEPAETIDLSLSVAGGPATATGTTTHEITINDTNDVSVAFTLASSTVGEAVGATAPTVTLTVPGGGTLQQTVTFNVAANGTSTAGPGDYTLNTTSVTFVGGAAVSGATQPVNIDINPDIAHEPSETIDLDLTYASGPAVNTPDAHTVTITDDDNVLVAFTNATSSFEEDAATHSPTLTLTIPGGGTLAAAVTVDIIDDLTGSAATPADYTLTTTSVTFPISSISGATADVDVLIAEDVLAEANETIDLSVAINAGPVTIGTQDTHEVTITDDETPNITVTPSGGSTLVTEDGTDDTFAVGLTTAPSGTVIVTLSKSVASGDYDFSPTTLTFTTGNWSSTQPVTVSANDDPDIEGDEPFVINLSASGGGYTGRTNTAGLTVEDDDAAGMTFSKALLSVTEGGSNDTYTVVLDARPASPVTVTITSATGEATASPLTWIFTTANWDVPKVVTGSAVDDAFVDGATTDSLTHTLTSSDSDFDLVADNIPVNVADNDVPGVIITESDGTTSVIEGGATDSYTVELAARPMSDVTVTITTDVQTTASPLTLDFTSSTWNAPQTVTITALQDGIDEVDPHPGVIQHSTSSTDPDFDNLTVGDVTVSIGDSDALLVTIDGPNFGAPGEVSVFTAMVNAGGTGAITYEWTVFFNGNPVATGDQATFSFTPSEGGAYVVRSLVGDTQGQNPAEFIQFKVLGDIEGSVFVADIIWMAEEGITLGCNPPANDNFCPSKTVTRGQMAAFLVRFLGLTAIDGSIAFTDTSSSVFEQDILKLATAGITRGCNADGTEFCPNKGVTRGQMAAFLVRAFFLTDDGGGNLFDDDDTSIFENDIDKLATAGITLGCNPPANNNFCPAKTVTRGQMSAFLHRAEGLITP